MPLLNIEFGLSVLAVALAFALPCVGDRWFSAIESRVNAFAARRRLAVATIFFLALSTRLAVLPIEPIPHPGVHDEFSHLLVGDTLAHGRLANPTPRLWEHFETFHENFVPAYASMYYPGQGIFLALGQVVFGHPFWGVWLSSGLMCAAFCWALQGWVPSGWAFLGGILAIIRLGTFSYWDNSYWGGAVGALGGALVIGAFPRIADFQRTRDALLMALGLALIANTRPFEGLFFCLPLSVALLGYLLLCVRPPSAWMRAVLLPASAVIGVTVGLMALYFYRTTGHPFTIPYKINMDRYGYVYFPWQKFRTAGLHFNHEPMRAFYEQQLPETAAKWTQEPLEVSLFRCLNMWSFFLNSALTIPLCFLVFCLPVNLKIGDLDWRLSSLILAVMLSVPALLLPTLFLSPHYAAALACSGYVLYILAARRVSGWSPAGRPVGRALVRAVPIVCLLMALGYLVNPTWRPVNGAAISTWYTHWEPIDRTGIEQALQGINGNHLVIVRYGSNHDLSKEWVYNGADVEHSNIIWARDMGQEQNDKLIGTYCHRSVWLLKADDNPMRLLAYSTRGNTDTAPGGELNRRSSNGAVGDK